MVMDMFYSYVETEKKKRVHFHGFMLDVHKSELPGGLNRACMIVCLPSLFPFFMLNYCYSLTAELFPDAIGVLLLTRWPLSCLAAHIILKRFS